MRRHSAVLPAKKAQGWYPEETPKTWLIIWLNPGTWRMNINGGVGSVLVKAEEICWGIGGSYRGEL